MSWTEDHDKAASGKRVVKFYDDEGTSSVRKVKVYVHLNLPISMYMLGRIWRVSILLHIALSSGSEVW